MLQDLILKYVQLEAVADPHIVSYTPLAFSSCPCAEKLCLSGVFDRPLCPCFLLSPSLTPCLSATLAMPSTLRRMLELERT